MSKVFIVKIRRGMKRKTVSQRIKESEKIIGIFCSVSIVVMSLLYIFQMSTIATNGYEIEKYEQNLENLKKENQKIIIELADLKAMRNLDSESSGLIAVEYNNVTYITSKSSAVAIGR
ncbi:MAG: hypothetical protein P1P85_05255 [Patescibacteria group bacterium]|nr:hypothetical protein [Patescibacteria group bacterium]